MSSGNKQKVFLSLEQQQHKEIFLAFARRWRRKFKEEKSLSRKLYLIYRLFFCGSTFAICSSWRSKIYIVAPKNDKVLNCLSGTIFYISLPAVSSTRFICEILLWWGKKKEANWRRNFFLSIYVWKIFFLQWCLLMNVHENYPFPFLSTTAWRSKRSFMCEFNLIR